jgi:hypothetical protein
MYTKEEQKLIAQVLMGRSPSLEDQLIMKMRRIIEQQENKIKQLNSDLKLVTNHFNKQK